MRAFVLGTMLLVLLAACSPISTVTPIPPVTEPAINAPATAPAAGATTSPAQQPAQPATGGAPVPAGPISLQVLSPQDGAEVNASQIQVVGITLPGAVVTVNDDVMIAGSDGRFQSNVTLTEGPNLIQVVASNSAGDEADAQLTVTYEP